MHEELLGSLDDQASGADASPSKYPSTELSSAATLCDVKTACGSAMSRSQGLAMH